MRADDCPDFRESFVDLPMSAVDRWLNPLDLAASELPEAALRAPAAKHRTDPVCSRVSVQARATRHKGELLTLALDIQG
jgi:hypothetical protein